MRKNISRILSIVLVGVLVASGWIGITNIMNITVEADEIKGELEEQNIGYDIRMRTGTITPQPGISPELGEHDLPNIFCGLLQVHKLPSNDDLTSLNNLGVTIESYIPNLVYLVTFPSERLDEIISYPNVRWIGEIPFEDKISPYIFDENLNDHMIDVDGFYKVIVKVFNNIAQEEAADILMNYGSIDEVPITSNFWTVSLSKDNVYNLAKENCVMWIEGVPPPPQTLLDGSRACVGNDWLHERQPYDLRGDCDNDTITIAEWDEGFVDNTHPDFLGRVILADNSPGVLMSDHATHVGGIAIGDGTNSDVPPNTGDPFQWRGMADRARIASYRWPDTIIEMDTEFQDAIYNHQAKVSQNSWAWWWTLGGYTTWSENYDDLARGKDQVNPGEPITIVFAAGNNRWGFPQYYTISSGGQCSKNTITVGAIEKDHSMTEYSGWGPTDDGRLKPDVVAVGGDRGSGVAADLVTSTMVGFPDGGGGTVYTYFGDAGTSMAAPVVSGTSALIYEEYRRTHRGYDPLPNTVKGILIHTAEDYGNEGPDYQFGFGKINATSAIDLVREDAIGQKRIIEGTITATSGSRENHCIELPEGAIDLKATLVWDDVPGNPLNFATDPELVNDLDLSVLKPSGSEILPLILDPFNPDDTADYGVDRLNTVEQVYYNPSYGSELPKGRYTVVVRGHNVPMPPQRYSLIITYKIPAPNREIRDDDGTMESSLMLTNPGVDRFVRKDIYIGSGTLFTEDLILGSETPLGARSAKIWIYGKVNNIQDEGITMRLEVNPNDNPNFWVNFDPVDLFSPNYYQWRSFDVPLSCLHQGELNTIRFLRIEPGADRALEIGMDMDNDYGRSHTIFGSENGEWMIYIEIPGSEITNGMIIRDDDGERDGLFGLNNGMDDIYKYIYIPPNAMDEATNVKLFIYGMGQYTMDPSDDTISLRVNGLNFEVFNPCIEFGVKSLSWASFDIPLDRLVVGGDNIIHLERIGHYESGNYLAIGVDVDHDYGRSIILNEVYTDPENDYPGEAMIYLQINNGKVYRDDDATWEGQFGLNSPNDEATKSVIVGSNGLIGMQSARVWVCGMSQNPLDPRDTIRLEVNGHVWGDFNPCDIFSTDRYEWHSFEIMPSWLNEGGENEIVLDRTQGHGYGNYLAVGVDTDHDYGRSILLNEFYTDPENDYPGEVMIYIQIIDGIFVRLDDNERDSNVELSDYSDWATKTLTITEPISNIDSATLWVYGRGNDFVGHTGDSHRLRVNDYDNYDIYFNPSITFNDPMVSERWWKWVAFDIPVFLLKQNTNTFNIRDSQNLNYKNNLLIGIDDDSNHGASEIHQDGAYLDGELMMYLKLVYKT
jgi:hypothetical protein